MRPDLVVAGGGPAGLATAIAARLEGLDVVVIEPREGIIDKACGEGVMPAGVALLRDLGVRARGRPFSGIRYVKDDVSAEGRFRHGHGLGIRRLELHEAMRDRAASVGVRFRRGEVTSIDPIPEGARFLVGADGLRSRVRALLGVERPARRRPRFGMRRHFRVAPWTDRVEVHFARGAEAYVTPVDDDTIGLAFLFEPPATWDALLARFPVLTQRIAAAAPVSTLRGAGPFERRVARRVVGNVLLVGDAAGYLDPLTGEGIALGMLAAREAALAMVAGDPARYESRWRAITRRHFALTSTLLAIVRRPTLHRPLVAAARALPSVFDHALDDAGTVIDRAGSAPASLGTLRGLPTT